MNFNLTSFVRNSSRIFNGNNCKYGCNYFDSFSEAYDPIHKPLSLLICIFGICANGINLVVLTRRGMVTATNILLTGLSAAQLFLLLNYLLLLFYNYLVENCLYPSKKILKFFKKEREKGTLNRFRSFWFYNSFETVLKLNQCENLYSSVENVSDLV